VLESAYGPEPVYQQPAMDDYGYGDPGYADPSYDGPRTPSAPAAFSASGYRQPGAPVPGYQVPETGAYSRPGHPAPNHEAPNHEAPNHEAPGYAASGFGASGFGASGYEAPGSPDIYPVTGAQEALPNTGPQPIARPWTAQNPGGRPVAGGSAYPERWYDHPRLEDRVREDSVPGRRPSADSRSADPLTADSRLPDSRLPDSRLPDSRLPDPRLQGMRYDELRYDEPTVDGPRAGESLDDESWYEELSRNAPAFPHTSTGQSRPAGPARQAEPQRPGYDLPASYPQAPASPPDRFGGYGPDRSGSGSHERGGSGPQLSAGDLHNAGARPGGPQPAPSRDSWSDVPAAFLGAPTAQVGVLTPPAGSRIGAMPDSDPQLTSPFLAPPAASRPAARAVRPGHGLDGPEITSSWPAQPPAGADSFAEFWAEDDDEAEYSGLFGDRDIAQEQARSAAKRRIGRRRGGSNDHRLWLGLGGVVIVAAAAITGIIKFEFPSHGGPAHLMATPAKIGTYMRTVDLERQTNVAQLRNEVITMSAGHASQVVSAVYESGNSAAGNTEQIVMFIGGHLANAAPATSVTSFAQKFPGAQVVSAGSLGGKAACVEEGGTANSVSMCAWFDNDSFGEIVSPTMNASALAKEMLSVRPAVETVAGLRS
jgi:hypothetical protein